jgi:hypothetical protein
MEGMKKSTEIVVDGRRYLCNKYPGRFALRLLTRLTKLLAKPVAMTVVAETSESEKTDRIGLIGGAIDSLMFNIDPDAFEQLVTDVLEGTSIVDGSSHRSIIFDTDFMGSMAHLAKVLKEILAFQYSDFLAAGAIDLPSLAAQMKKGKIQAL